jgi:hypothetical protein
MRSAKNSKRALPGHHKMCRNGTGPVAEGLIIVAIGHESHQRSWHTGHHKKIFAVG